MNAADLPAEIRFLLDVIAAGLGGPAPQAEPGLDWASVLAGVRHHRLEPLMEPALTPEVAIPEEWRRKLAGMRRKATLRGMRLVGELVRLVRCFAEAGVEVLALKGPALSVLLYGDPYRRSCCDIDLLVRPEAEAEARTILARCGYGTTADAVVPCHNAVMLRHAQHAIPVELHVRLADDERLLSTKALNPFEASVDVKVAGARVRTLGLEAALAYAAYHGAKHHWSKLYWLADIAAATQRPEVDWPQVAEIARRTETDRHLALAARLSGKLFRRHPPGLRPLRGRDLAGVRRAEAIVPAILSLPPVTELEALRRTGHLHVLRSDLALHRRLRARWALLLGRLRPSGTDRAAVSLPSGLGFLYYAVRLARVLWVTLAAGRRERR